MLIQPAVFQPYRLIGIDPGTNCMGISFLEWGKEDRPFHVREAFTLTVKDNHPHYRELGELHGLRAARLEQLADRLGDIFRDRKSVV